MLTEWSREVRARIVVPAFSRAQRHASRPGTPHAYQGHPGHIILRAPTNQGCIFTMSMQYARDDSPLTPQLHISIMGGREIDWVRRTVAPLSTVVTLAELVAHAARLCAQKLRVQCLQSLQINIQSCDLFTRATNELLSASSVG